MILVCRVSDRLVDALVTDAHRLLEQLGEQEPGSGAGQAVALLALVAGQDVEPAEDSDGTDGRWRIARGVTHDRVDLHRRSRYSPCAKELVAAAYGTGEFRAELAAHGHIDRVKRAPVPRIVPGGFTVDDFTVDHTAGTATCPNGLTRVWRGLAWVAGRLAV
jgi:hypothetical protein